MMPKVQQLTAAKILSKPQRLACLGKIGAIRGTPTATMEVVLNVEAPENIGETLRGTYKQSRCSTDHQKTLQQMPLE
ncbi:hypothetical protein J6590_015563 [Homalodisca vitripennis]|nr:hypothetical protein J6590_015563 [Homalodisca vitripennis]